MKIIIPVLAIASLLSACNNDSDDRQNQSPSVTAPGLTSVQNTGDAFQLSFDVSDDYDPNSALSVSVSSDNLPVIPNDMIVTDIDTNAVTLEITPGETLGTAIVTLTVTDTEGLSTTANAEIEVIAETIEFNALARRVFDTDENDTPQNLDILDIQEGDTNDDFADLL